MRELRVGQKVLLETKEMLLRKGYRVGCDNALFYDRDIFCPVIIKDMQKFLGKYVTIETVIDSDVFFISKEEDENQYMWGFNVVAMICPEENQCHISIDEILNKSFKLEEQNENN